MAFVHNQPFERYPKGTIFSQEQLLQIKPEHVYNWLGKLAFGKVDSKRFAREERNKKENKQNIIAEILFGKQSRDLCEGG